MVKIVIGCSLASIGTGIAAALAKAGPEIEIVQLAIADSIEADRSMQMRLSRELNHSDAIPFHVDGQGKQKAQWKRERRGMGPR